MPKIQRVYKSIWDRPCHIITITSQSNGLAERSVQTIKNILKKCTESGDDMYLRLLDLRNTPKSSIMTNLQSQDHSVNLEIPYVFKHLMVGNQQPTCQPLYIHVIILSKLAVKEERTAGTTVNWWRQGKTCMWFKPNKGFASPTLEVPTLRNPSANHLPPAKPKVGQKSEPVQAQLRYTAKMYTFRTSRHQAKVLIRLFRVIRDLVIIYDVKGHNNPFVSLYSFIMLVNAVYLMLH